MSWLEKRKQAVTQLKDAFRDSLHGDQISVIRNVEYYTITMQPSLFWVELLGFYIKGSLVFARQLRTEQTVQFNRDQCVLQ